MNKLIKWAGSKTSLAPTIVSYMPKEVGVRGAYCEPFFGSGAVYFHLCAIGRTPAAAVLSDTCAPLINFWRTVRDKPADLQKEMVAAAEKYDRTGATYYRWRECFNGARAGGWSNALFFWALNRLGYNGLYRVNKAGEFNVPWGKRETLSAPPLETVLWYSRALRGATLRVGDFDKTLASVSGGNVFVYCDPPYVPASKTGNFVGYGKAGFGQEEQEALRDWMHLLPKRTWLLSNSQAASEAGLYKGLQVLRLKVPDLMKGGRSVRHEILVRSRA